ncbi:MAG: glycoside hydrolase family 99-like domain-containing protein [Candidatus Hydrogenedentales bacterium]
MIPFLLSVLAVVTPTNYTLHYEWDFAKPDACEGWHANGHFTDVSCDEGSLKARAVDWDPFFTCTKLAIPAKAAQCVLVQIRADKGGAGQLYWTADTSGVHGGFDAKKVTDFTIRGGEQEEVYIFPFWHKEEQIRQLRLDLYEGAAFEITSIAILDAEESQPTQDTLTWEFNSTSTAPCWHAFNDGHTWMAPPLHVPVQDAAWLILEAESTAHTTLNLCWSTTAMTGCRKETLYISDDNRSSLYLLELQGNPQWSGHLVGLCLEVPEPENIHLQGIRLSAEPEGPPDLRVRYFGFENALNRAARAETLMARFVNHGAGCVMPSALQLILPEQLRLIDGPKYEEIKGLSHGESLDFRWTLESAETGSFPVALKEGGSPAAETVLSFETPFFGSAPYVPEPQPIKTSRRILAYYFPGWDNVAKWDCIRDTAPQRKPLLGYYDEGKPACVDWQIKWAVENGISCFLVDWYWCEGKQYLLHWFDAYRKARYRDQLQVAIMWANHNPPHTHSREDWRAVVREWIDNYFSLPGYYQTDGKPAVYIWDAVAIRSDLGGSEAAADALTEAQVMAQEAGYKGISFVSLQHSMNKEEIAALSREGYYGQTSYHEWGDADKVALTPAQGRFEDVVATAPGAWEKRRAISGNLSYIPVVDTGWDSRPWHGSNARVLQGRSVEGFKALLQEAKAYCDTYDQDEIILGPLNEWGEGSYIEANLEFGFGMLEAVREVFSLEQSESFPQNLGPRDLGLGPYDFPLRSMTYVWDFNTGQDDWAVLMGIHALRTDSGMLCFESSTNDPALTISLNKLQAQRFNKLHIRMNVEGSVPENATAQVFWTFGDGGFSEAQSISFALFRDEEFHDYVLDLARHPRWHGKLGTFRFDPCNFKDARIRIDEIAFRQEALAD